MILINSETKQPCTCIDCLSMKLKNRLAEASWAKPQRRIKVSFDSIIKAEAEPWYNRI